MIYDVERISRVCWKRGCGRLRMQKITKRTDDVGVMRLTVES